ncbi:hypothetical protein TTHERM_000760232 (macronuclear) [Tetrahymena thermophila SB210]|uniref:Uncharacterized protein n=1 Tax=Tetrahymena thermophila (strain SB210) TaxID=312017 RepID=W7WXZ6_TETTS|nr:hypothetical protein TTHERM_000760232 [Tetrahymena thermophila SB210]EWS71735.1 hypothetical protein TTHERM_000760232 [Tetrahymena thermophila SB210]|eukprot:XP_012655721.1 hypothetical protein TTHERM_000760232 [Tetrahymena thermophila SB210]
MLFTSKSSQLEIMSIQLLFYQFYHYPQIFMQRDPIHNCLLYHKLLIILVYTHPKNTQLFPFDSLSSQNKYTFVLSSSNFDRVYFTIENSTKILSFVLYNYTININIQEYKWVQQKQIFRVRIFSDQYILWNLCFG